MTSTTSNIVALALKHGASSYTNRADTQHPAYGFTEAALTAFAKDLLAGQCLHQIAEPAASPQAAPNICPGAPNICASSSAHLAQAAQAAVAVGIDLPDVEDMAHSAVQEALSSGVSHDVFHRWMRSVMDKTVAALATAPAHPAEGVLAAQAMEPAAIDPGQCAQDVFDNGVSVGLFDIPKDTANALCAGISAATGARVDWHYIGGRVHMKALAATPAAPAAAPVVLPEPRWHDPKPCDAAHFPYYTPEDVRALLAQASAADAARGHKVLVCSGALQMVVNALRRDAEEGKTARGEMADELLATVAPAAPAADALDAARYRWLRTRDLETIDQGGVFAGMTPQNVILNENDLDEAVDAAIAARAAQGGSHD